MCGYIVCVKLFSCGMECVKVYKYNGIEKDGVGVYIWILMEKMLWLLIEEDGWLNDLVLWENYIIWVFCLYDFYISMGDVLSVKKIVEFYFCYKLILMVYNL